MLERGWAVVLLLVVACGGKHEQTGKDAAAGAPADDEVAAGSGGKPPSTFPAQGAVLFQLSSVSPGVAGKMCPSGASTTLEIPTVADATEKLDADTYVHRVVDGEQGATMSCRISGKGPYELSARVAQAGKSLIIENGSVTESQGTASISLADSARLPGSLASPAPCQIDVGTPNLQIATGHAWARFSCASVEAAPSSMCAAQGYFVLENCEKD